MRKIINYHDRCAGSLREVSSFHVVGLFTPELYHSEIKLPVQQFITPMVIDKYNCPCVSTCPILGL